MFRTFLTLGLTFGLLCLSSFRPGYPYFDFNAPICNSTIAHLLHPSDRGMFMDDPSLSMEVDTTTRMRVLMLDYSVYGSAYNEKVRRIINRYLPKVSFTDFTEGTSDDLSRALTGCDAVIVAYPSTSASGSIKAYSKVLNQYMQQGGTVLFTGTHEFEVLQQFGLFDLDFGYFSKDRPIHSAHLEHPVFSSVNTEMNLANFAYPLDISDPGFVVLADVGGYPVIGFKPSGNGRVIYIGVEYYFDEAASSQILINALTWRLKERSAEQELAAGSVFTADFFKAAALKRSEELLYAGSGVKMEQIDLKVYPNPYVSKANLDIELTKPTPVSVDMTDETGRSVALILPKRTVGPGLCRFELPNIAPGIYFLKVQLDDKTYVRKVVKSTSN